ncbi:MAG: PilZ domain-containing protein [Desulfobacterales bacterium]
MNPSDFRKPSSERRGSPRIEVEIWAEEQYGGGVYYHRITNLSRDGFFIEKRLPFPVGSRVEVKMELPGTGERVGIFGKVVDNYKDPRARILGAGIAFVELDEKTRDKIDLYIRRLNAGTV